MHAFQSYLGALIFLGQICSVSIAQDDIGFGNGVLDFSTANFDVKLIHDSGTLASLKPSASDFDFLPYGLLLESERVQNGTYHWGDITIRYRTASEGIWTNGNSAARRTPVKWLPTEAIAATDMSPTLDHGPLKITREWLDIDGDLGLQFTIGNTGDVDVELGSLGFPAAVNNIFTNLETEEMYNGCSFMDPYIGLDAGYLRVAPTDGVGAALVVTPLYETALEAFRFLPEEDHGATRIESNGWEGFYEWQVHSKAWAMNEWENVDPWNPPSAVVLEPGQSRKYGLRFTVVSDGVRHIDEALRDLDIPTAIGVPGYVVPRDLPASLYLQYSSEISSITVHPQGSLEAKEKGNKTYTLQPSESSWGRARITISYENGRKQTVHYYITKSASEAIADLGHFITTEQWLDDPSDPFGRSPSPMGYDYDAQAIITQEQRAIVAGLSDEGGASAYVTAIVKQAFQPNPEEITKLESFIGNVLFNTVQDEEYSVKRSVFFYEPDLVPDYNYSSEIDWEGTFDRDTAYEIDRAYNYVWPAASYWAMYRVARAYPSLVHAHDWEWYLEQAYRTTMRGMQSDVGYNEEGLMGESVFGEILEDLEREGRVEQAEEVEVKMKARVEEWLKEEYPFGSEQSWDSTGQEGVHYWCRYVYLAFLRLEYCSLLPGILMSPK